MTRSNRDLALQKDAGNTMDRTSEERGRFKENGIKKAHMYVKVVSVSGHF